MASKNFLLGGERALLIRFLCRSAQISSTSGEKLAKSGYYLDRKNVLKDVKEKWEFCRSYKITRVILKTGRDTETLCTRASIFFKKN